MTFDDVKAGLTDREAVILTVYGEARGEPVEGQLAVINVIINRAFLRKLTPKEVCFQRLQFSCWNKNDKNFPILKELAEQTVVEDLPDKRELLQIGYLFDGVMKNILEDNTNKADHYMTTSLFKSDKKPSWAKNPKFTKAIGAHTFMRV